MPSKHINFPGEGWIFTCRDGRDIALITYDGIDLAFIVEGPCGSTQPDVETSYPSFDAAAIAFLDLARELRTKEAAAVTPGGVVFDESDIPVLQP